MVAPMSSTLLGTASSSNGTEIPTLEGFWPKEGKVKPNEIGWATYSLWTLLPATEQDQFCVAAQCWDHKPRNHKAAQRMLQLPKLYSELARKFYSTWNAAIYAYRGDVLVVPYGARDPEMRAKTESTRYLKLCLVAHLNIHNELLTSGLADVMIAYGAYYYVQCPIDKPFTEDSEAWWVERSECSDSVGDLFDWAAWSKLPSHKALLPSRLNRCIKKSYKKKDSVKYIDPDRMQCAFMWFYPHSEWFARTLYAPYLKRAEEDPLVDQDGQKYDEYMREMDEKEARGEITVEGVLHDYRPQKPPGMPEPGELVVIKDGWVNKVAQRGFTDDEHAQPSTPPQPASPSGSSSRHSRPAPSPVPSDSIGANDSNFEGEDILSTEHLQTPPAKRPRLGPSSIVPSSPSAPHHHTLQGSLFVCIHCDGSETSVVICDASGNVKGHALCGPTNFASFGVEAFVTAVHHAVSNALKTCISPPSVHPVPLPPSKPLFAASWLGVSGADSKAAVHSLNHAMSKLLGIPEGGNLIVTNDAHLLAAPLQVYDDVSSIITCIVGTNSTVSSFTRNPNSGHFEEIVKTGGWILGDQGGGCHIGKEAIRQIITRASAASLDIPSEKNTLKKVILKEFGLPETDIYKLLNPNDPDQSTSATTSALNTHQTREGKLSQLVPLVFKSAFEDGDPLALNVLEVTSEGLIDQISLMCRPDAPKRVDADQSLLCFGGPLVGEANYRDLVLEKLTGRGIVFKRWEFVDDAAIAGAQSLAATQGDA